MKTLIGLAVGLSLSFHVNAQYTCREIEFAELQTYSVSELKAEYCKNSNNLTKNSQRRVEIFKDSTNSFSKAVEIAKLFGQAWDVCIDEVNRILRILKSKGAEAEKCQDDGVED
jgi:hypothetical protein